MKFSRSMTVRLVGVATVAVATATIIFSIVGVAYAVAALHAGSRAILNPEKAMSK